MINLDFRTLRGTYEQGGKQGMIHMVSAGASQNRLVLGQIKVHQKSQRFQSYSPLTI
jgi:hypothetical protein